MIRNYIKVALRNLYRQRFYSLLNVVGLALGFGSSLVILFYVNQELNYDTFFDQSERIYRITTRWDSPEETAHYATSPPNLITSMDNMAGVKTATRLYRWNDFTMRPDTDSSNVYRETEVFYADSTFFDVFDYPWIAGDPETALQPIGAVVLPKSTAIKYFGKESVRNGNVLGRNILIGKDGGGLSKVTGIIEDLPPNSHINFEMLMSAHTLDDLANMTDWSWNIVNTYLLLEGNTDKVTIESRLQEIIQRQAIPNLGYTYNEYVAEGNSMSYLLQPLSAINLTPGLLRELTPAKNRAYITSLSLIAGLILLLAVANYINLSTARASLRAREVGIRKVLGSVRNRLIQQFLTESFLFTIVAAILGFGIMEILLHYSSSFGLEIYRHSLIDLRLIGMGILIIITVAFIAGFYPAMILSMYKPVTVLKGTVAKGVQNSRMRNVLVFFQFFISVALIVCTTIVYKQVRYIQTKNLGFNKENVLVIANDREIDERREEFIAEINKLTDVLNASFSTGIPGQSSFHMREFKKPSWQEGVGINWYQADPYYLETLAMKVYEGRTFTRRRASDSTAALLNQAAADILNVTTGDEIIKNAGMADEERLHVIGIIENFNFESFQFHIKPLVITLLDDYIFKDYISIRIKNNGISSTVSEVREVWAQFEPDVPMSYSFLDQEFDKLFKSEKRLSSLILFFTILAIIIACLGLFGLSAFVTDNSKKEIGIRKVMGATVFRLFFELTGRYTRIVIVALLLAIPVSHYIMIDWLTDFAYRTSIGLEIYVYTIILSLFIVLIAVGYHSISSAMTNPVESLRDE